MTETEVVVPGEIDELSAVVELDVRGVNVADDPPGPEEVVLLEDPELLAEQTRQVARVCAMEASR